MIKLDKINMDNMPAELKIMAYLDKIAPESGQVYIPSSELALALSMSESTVRRYLNKLKGANVIKIADKIFMNPDVFDLSIFARKAYEKTQNKIYNID